MKKILYVMKYPLHIQYSIMQKLNGEIEGMQRLGKDISFISFDSEYLYLNEYSAEGERKRSIIRKTLWGKSKRYFHFIAFYDIYSAARRLIRENRYDMVYFRYSPLNWIGYTMVRSASKKSRLVVEIPTFPLKKVKMKNIFRRLYSYSSRLWWEKSAKHITLFAVIGDKASDFMGVPVINIHNGVNVDEIPVRHPSASPDGKIHLLAVASMSALHGYDRIIRGLASWQDPMARRYVLDMVGDEGDGSLQEWKVLVQKLGMEDRVIFHGKMTGDALTNLYNQATIGISSLGIYRIGLKAASVLKLREYMARGLPFLYAHEDPDIEETMPWCLKMPNDDSDIPMEKLQEFIQSLSREKDLPDRMRAYAKKNMTWEKQFEKIFARLEKSGQ